MPDGNYRYLSDKSNVEQLKGWVNGGGKIVALEGAVSQLSKAEFGIKMKKNDDDDKKDSAERSRSPFVARSSLEKSRNKSKSRGIFGRKKSAHTG